ncbi:MAG: TonB-dependent receptor plug domain-containing protein, partial [Zoogloea sp.]|nr:TonB-dependent receptor plug domain-containing protein [Zoogloea sp.]
MKKTVIASLLAPLACHAWAAEDAAFSLGEIRVSASPTGSQAAPGSSVVESADLRQFDRETVGSALALAPGVSLSKVGKRNEEMVYVRGFDLRQTPVFIDGIPVYVPYDGYADFGRFNTYDLARIEVSKGFSSLIYGPNTLGGAINLITRRPTKPFEGEAGVGTTVTNKGEDNSWRTWANVGGRQDMWYYQAGVSMLNEDFFRLPDSFTPAKGEDGGRRENSYRQDSKLSFKLGLTPNAVDEYAVGFVKQHGQKGTPPYAGTQGNPSYWQWPYWDMSSLYFISTTRIGEHAFKLRAYHDTYRNSLTTFEDANYTDALLKPGDRSWYDDYTNGMSAEGDFRLAESNQLRAAYHLKEDVHREHNDNEPLQRSEDITQSFALEDSHAFGERLSLVTGLSYDKRRGIAAQDYDSKYTKKLYDLPLASADAANGMAGLFYKLAGGDKLRFTVARKSRFPTLKDRYSASFGTSIPNPDLQTEHANHFELGYNAG